MWNHPWTFSESICITVIVADTISMEVKKETRNLKELRSQKKSLVTNFFCAVPFLWEVPLWSSLSKLVQWHTQYLCRTYLNSQLYTEIQVSKKKKNATRRGMPSYKEEKKGRRKPLHPQSWGGIVMKFLNAKSIWKALARWSMFASDDAVHTYSSVPVTVILKLRRHWAMRGRFKRRLVKTPIEQIGATTLKKYS